MDMESQGGREVGGTREEREKKRMTSGKMSAMRDRERQKGAKM